MHIGLKEDEKARVLRTFAFFNVGEYHKKGDGFLKEKMGDTALMAPYLNEDIVTIPKSVLAELLIRGYSAIRIKLEPAPVECYATEMETEIEGKMHSGRVEVRNKKPKTPNFCSFDLPWPATKGRLSSYLDNVDSSSIDPLLNMFSGSNYTDIETREEAGIKFFLKGNPSFKVTNGVRGESTIPFHSHPEICLCPSREDLDNDFRLMGIVSVDSPGFTKFALSQKIREDELIQKKYRLGNKEGAGRFLSVNAIHRLAEAYVKAIMRDLGRYSKEKGCPVLMWERNERLPRKFVDRKHRFFVNYEILD